MFPLLRDRPRTAALLTLAAAALAGVLGWAYWPTLTDLVRKWSADPTYSHGYLVPAFALVLLYARRDRLEPGRLRPSWWGLLVVTVGTALRLASAYWSFYPLDRYSLLVVLAGMVLALGGWHALRWAGPSVAFLVFMIPLPSDVGQALSGPLQRVTTRASANVLQTLGFVAVPAGNVLLMPGGDLGVAEACSGLRMFMTFCALSTALAFIGRRSALQRVILVGSALPLAIACNVFRVTLTAVVSELAGHEAADIFHEHWAGWAMIAAALVLLWLEMVALGRLFVRADEDQGPSFTGAARRAGGAGAAVAASR
jgi:exosortase